MIWLYLIFPVGAFFIGVGGTLLTVFSIVWFAEFCDRMTW